MVVVMMQFGELEIQDSFKKRHRSKSQGEIYAMSLPRMGTVFEHLHCKFELGVRDCVGNIMGWSQGAPDDPIVLPESGGWVDRLDCL